MTLPVSFDHLRARWNQQKGRCFYCNKSLYHPEYGGSRVPGHFATRDHVKPKSKGGERVDNLVWSCRKCNTLKGNREPTTEERRRLLAMTDARWGLA